MAEILLAIESARSRAPQLNAERLLNCMTERQPAEAKSQAPIFGCPGISAWTVCGNSPGRGMITFKDIAYGVFGDGFYQVGGNGSALLLGSGIGGTLPVGIASTENQICIVNGIHGWTFDLVNGFVQISSAAFQASRTVSSIDDVFLFAARGTNQWFISAILDGQTFDALDFATAEAGSGQVVGVFENLQLVFVFCTDHIETWYDAGTADFPFQRYTGGVIPYGCISPFTICKIDGALFFMGADKVFYRLQANVPIRVSTHPMETIFATETDFADLECTTLTIEGHKLIFLTLPSKQITVCYDISTNRWHERESFDALFNSLGRYRLRGACQAYNEILVGDAVDGRVGRVDWSLFNEYGLAMYGEIDTINQHHDRKNIFCSYFELQVQSGNRTLNGAGSDPQMTLRRSIDGGMTYGKVQPVRSMGKTGETLKRLRWTKQGKGRQMMWKLGVEGPDRPVIIAASAGIEVVVA